MRIRKAVISVALSAAAIGGVAATPALVPSATAATTAVRPPFVGHSVGGALLTRRSLHVGQVVTLVGTTSGRLANYRVTAAHRDGEAFYVTVQPRLQTRTGDLVLFMTSDS